MPLLETFAIKSARLDIPELTSLITLVGSSHLKRMILFVTSISLHRQIISRWIDSVHYDDWVPLVQALKKAQEGIAPTGVLMQFCIVVKTRTGVQISQDDFVRSSEAMQQFQYKLGVALKDAAHLTIQIAEEASANKYFLLAADQG
jgi:hypothetical protein